MPFEPLTLSTGRSSTEAATDGPEEVEGGSSRLNRGSGNGKEETRWTQAVRTQHRGDSGLTGCLGPVADLAGSKNRPGHGISRAQLGTRTKLVGGQKGWAAPASAWHRVSGEGPHFWA